MVKDSASRNDGFPAVKFKVEVGVSHQFLTPIKAQQAALSPCAAVTRVKERPGFPIANDLKEVRAGPTF